MDHIKCHYQKIYIARIEMWSSNGLHYKNNELTHSLISRVPTIPNFLLKFLPDSNNPSIPNHQIPNPHFDDPLRFPAIFG